MNTTDLTRLAGALNDVGADALEQLARDVLLPMVLADLPVGDPEQDPDPQTSLAANTRVERDGQVVRIVIDTPYAAVQHYAPYQHPRGGRARFLEDNLQAVSGQVERVLAAAVRRRLAREDRA